MWNAEKFDPEALMERYVAAGAKHFYDVRADYKSPGTSWRSWSTSLPRTATICGEGIFGTRSFRVFGEGPSRVLIDHFREDRVGWTAEDIRFTQRDNTVYAFLMRWPTNGSTLIRTLSPADNVRSVRLLGADNVLWEHTADGLTVRLPRTGPTGQLECLAIRLD